MQANQLIHRQLTVCDKIWSLQVHLGKVEGWAPSMRKMPTKPAVTLQLTTFWRLSLSVNESSTNPGSHTPCCEACGNRL